MELKTLESQGTLLYGGETSSDFIGLYLKDGKIHFGFNCGSGTGQVASAGKYNDNNWHKVGPKMQNYFQDLFLDFL